MALILADRIQSHSVTQIAGPEASTKSRLIGAGEKLLGERGLDTTPLHEIASQAGQSNNYAVQYHFEDREGLVRAIFALRLSSIERRERELIAVGEQRGALHDLKALLELIFVPIAEQVDEEGRHSYARFLLQYVTRPNLDHRQQHPLGMSDDPVGFVFDRLVEILAKPRHIVMRRLYLQTLVFLGALIERDNALNFGRPVMTLNETLSETFAMMVAALTVKHEASWRKQRVSAAHAS